MIEYYKNENEIKATAASAVTGLTGNNPYPFAAAYKGNDKDAFVWTSITSKSLGDYVLP